MADIQLMSCRAYLDEPTPKKKSIQHSETEQFELAVLHRGVIRSCGGWNKNVLHA